MMGHIAMADGGGELRAGVSYRRALARQRIDVLLAEALDDQLPPRQLVERIVVDGIAGGLDWYEIVFAVDEAERRTGLTLHPTIARE